VGGGLIAEQHAVEQGVASALAKQLIMATGLDHDAVLDHENAVSVNDGVQAVGDHQGSAPGAQAGDRILDVTLRFGIEGGGRLVEQDDGRVAQQSAGDRHSLALAAGQLQAVLADGVS
jgi:hypothetical protein